MKNSVYIPNYFRKRCAGKIPVFGGKNKTGLLTKKVPAYWCIRPICPVGPVRLPTITDNSMKSQKTPGKRPATPREEYPRYQGPNLKEKAKREANQWGEGSEGGNIPASRLLEQGLGFLTIPVRPSFHPPPPFSHTPHSPPLPPPHSPCHRALADQ